MVITQKHKIKKNSLYPLVSCPALCMYWLCTLFTVKGSSHTVQVHNTRYIYCTTAVLRIRTRWIRNISGLLDPDPQKYADPRIRIQWEKYQQKLREKKTNLLSNHKSELMKKREYKNFLISVNGSSFSIKISEKK